MDQTATAEHNTIGLIKNFEIALVKTDPELIDRIVKARRKLDHQKARYRMRYNCWPVPQFAQLCGRAIPTITQKTLQPILENGKVVTLLNFCYPFPGESLGPKFVVRDEKSIAYLESCL